MKYYNVIFVKIILILIFLVSCGGSNDEVFEKPVEKNKTWFSYVQDEVTLEDVNQKSYYIIFDGSGSMAGEKLTVAKKALKEFIKAIPERSKIGLLAFDESGISERAPLGSTKDNITLKVDEIGAGGRTPLGEAVKMSYFHLSTQAKKQLGYGEYNLVIITDGQATDRTDLIDAVSFVLDNSPIIIHTIGFHIGEGHVLNQPGKIYYKTANNYDELSKGLESVLAEMESFSITKFK